jgi:hypothetical protein
LTRFWQSSKTPSTAMLCTFASCSEYICARWKALIRPCGESMNTLIRSLPRRACSAADPVSPEVAPTMFSTPPVRSSAYSSACPRNCIAMSLKASVGPSDSPTRVIPPPIGVSGTGVAKTEDE